MFNRGELTYATGRLSRRRKYDQFNTECSQTYTESSGSISREDLVHQDTGGNKASRVLHVQVLYCDSSFRPSNRDTGHVYHYFTCKCVHILYAIANLAESP